jgi:hypothetical protein
VAIALPAQHLVSIASTVQAGFKKGGRTSAAHIASSLLSERGEPEGDEPTSSIWGSTAADFFPGITSTDAWKS